MKIVFFSTSDVFKAEEVLTKEGIKCNIVPTPATDKAYCGVCVETDDPAAPETLVNLEYEIIQ